MLLINNIISNDTKELAYDESLQSYFKHQFEEVNKKSFDVNYRNIFNSVKHDNKFIEEIRKIPVQTKIVRNNKSNKCSIVFIKEDSNFAFSITFPNETIKIIQPNYVFE